MKILVVSDRFDNGGLETHIKTYYENLPENVEMVFLFGKYTGKIKLENAKIYDDFDFFYNTSVENMCYNVKRIIDIIKKENIDVVHSHPFYNYYSVLFACQLTNTKLVYTYHGLASFNYSKSNISAVLFYYSLECNALSNVFSVSQNGVDAFKNLGYKNAYLLPNPIDLTKYPKANVVHNNKWALISRIDVDKLGEIQELLANLDKYEIDSIDIFGDGSEKDKLQEFINGSCLDTRVQLMGYSTKIFEDLNGKYNGVIGIGRVLLEAFVMGYPTFLIGYNKLTGFVDKKIYNNIKDMNYINFMLNSNNKIKPKKADISYICNDSRKRSNINNIMITYLNCLQKNDSIYVQNIKDLFNELCKIAEDDEEKVKNFYASQKVYDLTMKYINCYSLWPIINNLYNSTYLY